MWILSNIHTQNKKKHKTNYHNLVAKKNKRQQITQVNHVMFWETFIIRYSCRFCSILFICIIVVFCSCNSIGEWIALLIKWQLIRVSCRSATTIRWRRRRNHISSTTHHQPHNNKHYKRYFYQYIYFVEVISHFPSHPFPAILFPVPFAALSFCLCHCYSEIEMIGIEFDCGEIKAKASSRITTYPAVVAYFLLLF